MTDREKVIRGLENAKNVIENWIPMFEQYNSPAVIDEAIALIEEQEPIKPYMDYDGQDVWRCGKCGNSLMHPSYYGADEDAKNYIRYCSHCGRAVKWDAETSA